MSESFKSDRHAALDSVYPGKRYCACKQGRAADCQCAYREEPARLNVWLVIIILATALAAYLLISNS